MVERDRRLGERLAQLRRRRGMSQEVLAERSGVSVSVIRKLERSERDSAGLSTVRKFASALGVPTMELFAPTPAFAGPVDEYERDDLYDLRRVLQPPRGVDGASVFSLAEDDGRPGGLVESLRIADGLFRDDDFAAAAAALPTLIIQARVAVAESVADASRPPQRRDRSSAERVRKARTKLRACGPAAFVVLGLAQPWCRRSSGTQ